MLEVGRMIINPIYHIDQCISEMNRFFPRYSLSQIRSEVVANDTFGTPVYNGKDPFFIELSKEYVAKREDKKDAKGADIFVELVNEMTSAILWNRYKIIYTLDNELAEALSKTDNLIFTKDIFDRIPYQCFYINLSLLPEYKAEGCIVAVHRNTNSDAMILVDIQLIGGKDVQEGDGTYEFLVFVSSNGKAPIIQSNRTVTEGIFWDDGNGQFNICAKDYIETAIKGQKALLKKTRMGHVINPENPYLFLPLRKRMVSLELLVLQFMMYLSSDSPDVSMSKETKKQLSRNQRLKKNIQPHSEIEKWDVGVRYGNKIRLYKQQHSSIEDKEETINNVLQGHHCSPRPHMRRAHWHYYWTGEKRSVKKHVWVAPTFINGTKNDMPITIVDVTNKDSQGYDGENHIKDYLTLKNIKFRPQYTVKSTRKRYDFCIINKQKRMMVEFDGEQHFSPVEYWGGEEAYNKQRKTDTEKTIWCEDNGIPLLRIRFDQKPFIQDMLKDLLQCPEKYLHQHNTFMSNEEYYSICK